MEVIYQNVKNSVNASRLVDLLHQKNAARKVLPSRYGIPNNVNFKFDQPNVSHPFTACPPQMHSNTQSDPLGLQRSLLVKQFPFLTPRRKRTGIRNNQAKKLQKSLSEPTLSIINDNDEVDHRRDFDTYRPSALIWQNIQPKPKTIPIPTRYDKIFAHQSDIFVKKDKNNSGDWPTILTYNPIRALETKDDDTVSESCSTNYASSSDNNIYVVKYPKTRHRKPSKTSNKVHHKKSLKGTPKENFEDHSHKNFHHLKESEKNSRQKSRCQQKEHHEKQKGLNSKLDKIDLFKLADLKNQRLTHQTRKQRCNIPEHFKTYCLPEKNFEFSENYKKMNSFSRCDNHPKVVKRTRNPESRTIHTTPKKVTDEELWQRFQKIFKKYASTKVHSAAAITHELSTYWMTNAGLVDEFMTEEEATTAFKKVAGMNYTMNIYQYKEFLINLTKKKKLPLYVIYRKMCGL